MALKTAAMITNGVVVNASVYDEDTSAGWLAAVSSDYDYIVIADTAGIGWTLEEDELRPPSPFSSWVWNGTEWEAPVAQPDGPHYWDEGSLSWKPVE